MEKASTTRRFIAFLIDTILVLAVAWAANYLSEGYGGVPNWLRFSVLFSALFFYEPLFVSFTGGTIGHQILGLRVCKQDAEDQNLSFIHATLRFIIKLTIGWILVLVNRMLRKNKIAIHDRITSATTVRFVE